MTKKAMLLKIKQTVWLANQSIDIHGLEFNTDEDGRYVMDDFKCLSKNDIGNVMIVIENRYSVSTTPRLSEYDIVKRLINNEISDNARFVEEIGSNHPKRITSEGLKKITIYAEGLGDSITLKKRYDYTKKSGRSSVITSMPLKAGEYYNDLKSFREVETW